MSFSLTSNDYMDYMEAVMEVIAANKDYISGLDAATGDGDHWVNINMGFEKIIQSRPELETLSVADLFKKIGMLMMSTIGGSSGVLYGSAYINGAKTLKDATDINQDNLCDVLASMCQGIMDRGKAEPGFKTMVDALYPAVEAYKAELAKGTGTKETLEIVRKASLDGAESTKAMEAIRGRAYYQAEKGVGHLDPGAVTMSYQIAGLMEYILQHKLV